MRPRSLIVFALVSVRTPEQRETSVSVGHVLVGTDGVAVLVRPLGKTVLTISRRVEMVRVVFRTSPCKETSTLMRVER